MVAIIKGCFNCKKFLKLQIKKNLQTPCLPKSVCLVLYFAIVACFEILMRSLLLWLTVSFELIMGCFCFVSLGTVALYLARVRLYPVPQSPAGLRSHRKMFLARMSLHYHDATLCLGGGKHLHDTVAWKIWLTDCFYIVAYLGLGTHDSLTCHTTLGHVTTKWAQCSKSSVWDVAIWNECVKKNYPFFFFFLFLSSPHFAITKILYCRTAYKYDTSGWDALISIYTSQK